MQDALLGKRTGVVLSGPPFPKRINDRTYLLFIPSLNERISLVGLTLALLIFDLQLQEVIQIVNEPVALPGGGPPLDTRGGDPYLEVVIGNGVQPTRTERLRSVTEIAAALTTLKESIARH